MLIKKLRKHKIKLTVLVEKEYHRNRKTQKRLGEVQKQRVNRRSTNELLS